MPLLANGVGLAQPLPDPIVKLIQRFDPELVDMVFRRDRLDGAKPWIFQAASQDDVSVEPMFLQHHGGEAHWNLTKRR